MDDDLIARVGTFFILLGMGLAILFSASLLPLFSDPQSGISPSSAHKIPAEFDYLFWAIVLLGLGSLLRRRAAPPPPSGRFSGIKGFLARQKARKEEKAKAKKK